MRTFTLSALVFLSGCLIKPNTTDQCFENRLAFSDTCDQELTNDDEDDVLRNCKVAAGDAIARGCATELATALKCEEKASQGVACEDYFEVVSEACAFEQGKVQGCFEF